MSVSLAFSLPKKEKKLFHIFAPGNLFFLHLDLGGSWESDEAFDAARPFDSYVQTVTRFMLLILLHRFPSNIPICMRAHPLEVTLKWSAGVPECQIFVKFNIEFGLFFLSPVVSFLKPCWNCVYRIDAGADRLKGKKGFSESGKNFLPTLKSWGPDCLYLHPCAVFPVCWLFRCSLRCVIYGKQWISQYTVCLQNMLWLTFQWSRLSLWLHAKIVAVHFGCLPVWIYGGVSLSKGWWLVWVAVA